MAINHPQFGTFCEICYQQLTPDTCATDTNGQRWDICKGECARQAFITEQDEDKRPPMSHPPPTGFTLDDAIRDVLDAYTALHNGSIGSYTSKLGALYVALDTLKTQYEDTHGYPPPA